MVGNGAGWWATTLVYANPSLGGWLLVIINRDRPSVAAMRAVIARRVADTAMPATRAAFHSPGRHGRGVRRGGRALCTHGFDLGAPGSISGVNLFEMGLGCAIGALTFTGSVIAFLKLEWSHVRQTYHAAGAPCESI